MNHTRICAWLHLVSGVAILVVLSVVLAAVAAQVAGGTVSAQTRALMGTVGLALGTALCVVAGVELVGAVATLAGKPIGRPLLLLSAAFHVINLPIGTALGVYTFWALLRRPPPTGGQTMAG